MPNKKKKRSSKPGKSKQRVEKESIDQNLPSARATQEAAHDQAAAQTPPSSRKAPPPPKQFPVFEKAYRNIDFLTSPHARSIRVQCEMTEPEVRFREQQVENTIVLFGSARIPPPSIAKKNLKKIEEEVAESKSLSREQKRNLDHTRRMIRSAHYYQEATQLSHDLTKWSLDNIKPGPKRFYICSGGGPGIMEAASRGAYEAGGKSVGLGISLPFEQHLNVYTTPELGFEFHYFFVRKYWFLYLAKALVVFPGGFGTLDELFEMLTLVQTQKTQKYMPVVLYGSEFWNEVINFEALVDWGVISKEDLDLFRVSDSVDETRDYLIEELTRYYL